MDDDGTIAELILMDGRPAARILCSPRMIPAAGQYLLAHAEQSDAALGAVVFGAHALPDGFICAPAIPESWRPGTLLHMRGPLGRGFDLPPAARRIALIAFDEGARRLLYLLDFASVHDASVTLVAANPPHDLPLELEVQPLSGLAVVFRWSDYAAIDISRESLRALLALLGDRGPSVLGGAAQALVRTPMPCGGLAKCGVCAVHAPQGSQFACEDGPVFDLRLLLAER